MTFKYFEHQADIGIIGEGKTLEEEKQCLMLWLILKK